MPTFRQYVLRPFISACKDTKVFDYDECFLKDFSGVAYTACYVVVADVQAESKHLPPEFVFR
jgi:hypothetical protein